MIPYTELKHHGRQNLRELIPLPKPFTLIVEPSSLCNFRCVQCFQSIEEENRFRAGRSLLRFELFEEVVAQMRSWEGPRLKVLKLSLYGEPLLNPRFCEMLAAARAADIAERIETTTNASLLTPAVSERLVESRLDYVRVSIYSAIPEEHRRITGSAVDVATIRENLAGLQRVKRERGSAVPFVSVKMLDAYGEANEAFFATYRDVADELYLDKPHGWIPYDGKDFLAELYGEGRGRALQDVRASSSSRRVCTLPFFTLAVRSNGDVSPCCIDWIGGTTIGSLERQSLREIWEGDALYEFRKMLLEHRTRENPSCGRCEFYRSDYYTRDTIDGFPVERLRPAGARAPAGGAG